MRTRRGTAPVGDAFPRGLNPFAPPQPDFGRAFFLPFSAHIMRTKGNSPKTYPNAQHRSPKGAVRERMCGPGLGAFWFWVLFGGLLFAREIPLRTPFGPLFMGPQKGQISDPTHAHQKARKYGRVFVCAHPRGSAQRVSVRACPRPYIYIIPPVLMTHPFCGLLSAVID